jgi:hypothetical protein
MPLMGFEHTIPVFERAKTVHALDRAATMTGGFAFLGHRNANNNLESVQRLSSYVTFLLSFRIFLSDDYSVMFYIHEETRGGPHVTCPLFLSAYVKREYH